MHERALDQPIRCLPSERRNGRARSNDDGPLRSGWDATSHQFAYERTESMRIFDSYDFRVAEHNRNDLAFLRWALVIVFLWFGGMKFTAYEANGIAPFIDNSPVMHWLNMFGVQGQSYVIGVIELATAAALIAGAFRSAFSALGAAMSIATYAITLTFFVSTPGVAEQTAGGFPAISAAPGQFLLKDAVLLAASLVLFVNSVQRKGSSIA